MTGKLITLVLNLIINGLPSIFKFTKSTTTEI